MNLLSLILSGGLSALWHALIARLFGKPKDPVTASLENEIKAQRKEAENLASPAPDWKHVVDDL